MLYNRSMELTMPDYISTKEAAKRLGVSDRQVRRLIDQKILPAQYVGGGYIINPDDLTNVPIRPVGRPRKQKNQ